MTKEERMYFLPELPGIMMHFQLLSDTTAVFPTGWSWNWIPREEGLKMLHFFICVALTCMKHLLGSRLPSCGCQPPSCVSPGYRQPSCTSPVLYVLGCWPQLPLFCVPLAPTACQEPSLGQLPPTLCDTDRKEEGSVLTHSPPLLHSVIPVCFRALASRKGSFSPCPASGYGWKSAVTTAQPALPLREMQQTHH